MDLQCLIMSYPGLRMFILDCYENSDMDKLWHLLECLETDVRSC